MSDNSHVAATKLRFLEILLDAGVLRFGDFTTKSGRKSPYFFNTGHLDSGRRLGLVAECYAELIAARFGDKIENLFGPAYKGIPLAVMTADRLSRKLGRDISFTFNRKEAKAHGEGGHLVGRAYQGGEKVVVIEDVITGGTSVQETFPILRAANVDVVGFVVGIDRQERGMGQASAMKDVESQWHVEGASIIDIDDVVRLLHRRSVAGKIWIDEETKTRIDAYRAQYGAR